MGSIGIISRENRLHNIISCNSYYYKARLTLVGDQDQTIYQWRGANLDNWEYVKQKWPDTTVLRLEQNFRSTRAILRAAEHLVSHNIKRAKKSMWSKNNSGGCPTLVECNDEFEEAEYICDQIKKMKAENPNLQYKDIAVLYRTNSGGQV
jgi:superfamily I DNA/RNA helicase